MIINNVHFQQIMLFINVLVVRHYGSIIVMVSYGTTRVTHQLTLIIEEAVMNTLNKGCGSVNHSIFYIWLWIKSV